MNEEERWKRSTCLWELYKGNLEGELLYRGLWKMNEEGLWKRSTCLWELYKGNLEGELLYRGL
jgi:hypothetical protein